MTTRELLELFKSLECPTISEMSGEFSGVQLRAPGPVSSLVSLGFTNNPLLFGKWLSKSFRPIDAVSGRGYNTLRNFGRLIRTGLLEQGDLRAQGGGRRRTAAIGRACCAPSNWRSCSFPIRACAA